MSIDLIGLSIAKKYTDKQIQKASLGEVAMSPLILKGAVEASYDGSQTVEVEIPQGSDGFSPIAAVESTTEGAVITITDKNGTTTATITNGKDSNVDLSNYVQQSELPTKVSQLQNDSGYLTTVPDGYAKMEDIPKSPADIGAQPSGNYALKSEIPSVPIQSVNGKIGEVKLSASDVGARPDNWMPSAQEVGALPNTYTPPNQTAEQVGADPKGTAKSAVSQHNTADDSHNDIRLELKAINDRLTAFFDSDNQTLDELSEIVTYITSNKSLIDSITTSKVSVVDIINNLTTNVSNKPLSAAQGVVLKDLINTLSGNLANYQPKDDYALRSELPVVPTKVSQFQNDAGYLTQHQDISHKLDANKLPEAVNTALAQAKESGEFDGPRGQSGVYVGSGNMPEDCNVQIDPEGVVIDPEDLKYVLTDADKQEIAELCASLIGNGNEVMY